MKITDIDVFILKTPLDTPFAFSQGWVKQRSATLVRLTTDNGLHGWGEAFAQGLEPPEIAAAAIEHALKPLLIGENALDSSVLWQKMYSRTRDYGRKGSVVAAISAVDIALWDLAGHFYQQPVYQLLGGAARTTVRPYATGFYRITGQQEAGRLAEEAVQHASAGFSAMKVKLGFGIRDDLDVMQAIGKAISNSEIELMVDTKDVAQPDIGSCGGISAARDIAVLAQANGVMVNPHVWGSAVAQAASLQLLAWLPVAHHSLYAAEPILEYDLSSHPFRQDLITQPVKLDNGIVNIPDGPGLGIEVRMDTIERHRVSS